MYLHVYEYMYMSPPETIKRPKRARVAAAAAAAEADAKKKACRAKIRMFQRKILTDFSNSGRQNFQRGALMYH